MTFRNYLTGTIFIILLVWAPVNHSWPVWLLIRTGYLMLVPLAIWLLVTWVWSRWQPSDKFEVTLNRILSGIISAGLFALAILEATSTAHIGNTQTIRTRDGYEDVGDYIELPGPDYGNVIVLIILAILFLWLGVLKNVSRASGHK